MTLDPRGPAALIEKATGIKPTWAETEKQTISGDDGGEIFTYTPRFLGPWAVAEIAALTDPRVGWAIEIRPLNNQLRIRARKDTP